MKISVCISQRINNPDQTELEGCEGFKLPFHDDAVQDHALTKFRTDKNGGFVWVGAGYRVQEIPV